MTESDLMTDNIQQRLQQLSENWDELRSMANTRGQKLDESLAYQQFSANVEEEEAWILEKQHLLSGDDMGDTLAAVQVTGRNHLLNLKPPVPIIFSFFFISKSSITF